MTLDSLRRADSTRVSDSLALVPKGPKRKFELFEIEDADLLRDLWNLVGKDSTLDDGRYQVLRVSGDSVPQAFLLREGTQVGRLPDSSVEEVRRVIRARSASSDGRLSQNLLGNFWNPLHPLAPFQWPTGLYFEFRHNGTILKNSTPELEQTFGGTFGVRPVPWAHAELGLYRSRYGGGISRNLYNPRDDRTDWNWWSDRHTWGHIGIGVPGIKYEIGLDNRTLPEYFWLDPNGGSGSYVAGLENADPPSTAPPEYADGVVVKGWKRGGRTQAPTPNYSQTIRVKVGQVRYAAVFDNDVYNSVIHDLMFDGLPAPFGQWGLGFILAEGAAHTHMRVDLFPVKIGIPVPAGSSFRFMFLRIDLAVRDGQTFHAGLATAMHLDSPILRPGDTP